MRQTLSFGEVERILGRLLHVSPERMSTLRARLKQWQKLGFPDGIQTGKGVRAEYGPDQVLKIMMLARLLGAGMSLENAVLNVNGAWVVMKAQIVRSLIAIALNEGPIYLTVSVDALAQLRFAEPIGKLGVMYSAVGLSSADLTEALERSTGHTQPYDDRVFQLEGVTVEITSFVCAIMEAMRGEGRYFGAWKEVFRDWFANLESEVNRIVEEKQMSNEVDSPLPRPPRPGKFRQEAFEAVELVLDDLRAPQSKEGQIDG